MSEVASVALPRPLASPSERAEPALVSWDSGLIFVLLLGLVVRTTVIFAFPSLYHPDENFQFLEQAHRLAFGYGIVPWELSDGLRSLLLPYLFGRLFAVIAMFGGGPRTYLLAGRMLLAALSLVTVAVVYRAALRQSRTHALLAGVVAASWFEIVYFSARPLTEALAANFLLLALALAARPREQYSLGLCTLIGFVLACCALLRIQLAPGVAIIALWALSGDVKRRLPCMLLGGLLPLAAFGVADYVAWGSAFHSYIAYVKANALEGKAKLFGVEPYYWFGTTLVQTWAGAFPLLAALIVGGWRRYKLWILVSALIIGVHSLIPHKEYRFVYPAYACLIIVAALASADFVVSLRARFGAQREWQARAAAVAFWIATSGSLAVAPGFVDNWTAGRQLIKSFFWLHDEPQACGIQLLDHSFDETGGYAYLHRNIPMYDGVIDPRTASIPTAYNYIVLDREHIKRLPGMYSVQRCFGGRRTSPSDVCVAVRPGTCTTATLPPLLEQKRLGQYGERPAPANPQIVLVPAPSPVPESQPQPAAPRAR